MENFEKELLKNKTEQEFEKFEVKISSNGMPSIQAENPSPEIRNLIHRAINADDLRDPAYEFKHKAGAFLQSDSEDYILVEFWMPGYQPFVDYLNQELAKLKKVK